MMSMSIAVGLDMTCFPIIIFNFIHKTLQSKQVKFSSIVHFHVSITVHDHLLQMVFRIFVKDALNTASFRK